ncbi:MAG: VWA domain-containing protein [Planctomycetia bacterium]|nr:VWA domain-containing protein [Planctomycetia bacterium]
MPTFPPNAMWFAVAGAVAACVPIVLHLINRRRVRVIHWAAMDFLRVSVQRSRRLLQLRDLLLMLLRAAALLLFGLALARPYIALKSADLAGNQPLHAVLLLDNSLSMSYQQPGGTLLADAKQRARAFVDRLPEGSRVSVVPVCGNPGGYRLDAYASKDDAREAIDAIQVVDRAAASSQVATLAAEACRNTPSQMSQRLVLWTDRQEINWPAGSASDWKQQAELQVVPLGPPARDNAWISEFRVQDAVANVDTPTLFKAVINYVGDKPRADVQAVLTVDGQQVDSRTVNLVPGQSQNIDFEYTFKNRLEAEQVTDVPVTLSLTPDRMPADDARSLVVPVVAALPVAFVDQWGSKERPREGIRGETYPLRRLLSPVTSRTEPQKQLVSIRHYAVGDLTRDKLASVRLVVMAGVPEPGATVDLLRQYVEQGGQLVIAAGGRFDPAAWTRTAWRDGEGILPLPLASAPIGETLNEAAATVNPLRLDVDRLTHDYFLPPQMTRDELKMIYSKPLFFKSIGVDADDPVRNKVVQNEAKRLTKNLTTLVESDRRQKHWAEQETRGTLDAAARSERQLDEARRAEIEPHWLRWENARTEDPLAQRPAAGESIDTLANRLAEKTRPEPIAWFDNGRPYIVERQVGRGRITLVASGVFGDWGNGWNTLGTDGDPAMLLYDRLLRGRLENTLPDRNLPALDQISLPIRTADRYAHITLARPNGITEDLSPQFLDAQRFGLTLNDLTERGIYTVTARASQSADPKAARVLWQVPLAVNGRPGESNLAPIGEEEFKKRLEGAPVTLVNSDQELSLQGSRIFGESWWKWLILSVLVLLLTERWLVARTAAARGAAT